MISRTLVDIYSDVKDACYGLGSAIGSLWYSSEVTTSAKQTVADVGRGFFQSCNLSTLDALWESKDSRAALGGSLSANILCYMAPALLYEAVKTGIRHYHGEGSYAEVALDIMATVYLVGQKVRCYNDNLYYNAVLAKSVAKDCPDQSGMLACGDSDSAIAQAALTSSIYYAGNLLAIHIVCSSLPYGSYLRFPLMAYLDGQCILEAKLAAVGTCSEHRYELQKINSNIAFGMGLNYRLPQVLLYLLEAKTGLHSSYVNEAVLLAMYPFHMMGSLLIDKPLHNQKRGYDVLYFRQFYRASRYTTESLMNVVIKEVIPALYNSKSDYDLLALAKKIVARPPLRLALRFMLGRDFLSLDAYLQRDAVRQYLNANKKEFIGTYDYLNELREFKYRLAKWVLHYVKSKNSKTLAMIQSSSQDPIFKAVNDFLNQAYPERSQKDRINLAQLKDAQHIAEASDGGEEVVPSQIIKAADKKQQETSRTSEPVSAHSFLKRRAAGSGVSLTSDDKAALRAAGSMF